MSGTAPKRDKFAALAASKAGVEGGGGERCGGEEAEEPEHVLSQKGGKFATLQKPAATKRDKFSALASRGAAAAAAATTTTATTKEDASAKKVQEWITRCEQREQLWKDLELAEITVLELLEYTQQTVDCLARQTYLQKRLPAKESDTYPQDDQEILAVTTQKVPQCIQQIHDKLAPAAKFIQAYKPPQRLNRLYQARIEEGLAVQRKKVLQALVALENQPSTAGDGSANGDRENEEPQVHEGHAGDKRKREE